MFEETFIKGAKENLALLGSSEFLKDAYLADGMAVDLQLGYRISVDFNYFTSKEFVPKAIIAAELSNAGSFVLEQADKGTILGEFERIKFSLFVYQYPLIFHPAVQLIV